MRMEKRMIDSDGVSEVEIAGCDDCLLNGGCEGRMNTTLKFRAQKTE